MIGQAERVFELSNLEAAKTNLLIDKLITFSSGKGGTGKTFLSLNIAYVLSNLNKKVLYIDLDLNFANSNIFLNIIPQATINQFFNRKKLFSETVYEYNPNLHFIFGESGNIEEPGLSNEKLKLLFTSLSTKTAGYDFIIADTAAGGTKEQIKLLSFSKLNIIVTQPEPTAVMDAYVMIKLLNEINYQGRNFILINKCRKNNEGINAFENIRTAANHFLSKEINLLGLVSEENIVSTSSMNQELVIEKYPEHSLVRQIKTVAASLIDITQMANIKHKQI